MLHPAPALALAVGVLGILIVLFWPVSGLLWRWVRAFRLSERVLIEDALKHLFDCEYRSSRATLESLAGALEVTGGRAAELIARLQSREFLTTDDKGLALTGEGRSYALRVVRIHRLWERYLSDETGLKPTDWHLEAEQREHRTSSEEAEALAARMGHPSFDPHGDPIPTAAGEIPPPRGFPLADLPLGELGEIVHVEDEPSAVYAQLVAEGLLPGMHVRVLETTPQRIRFEAETGELVLAPVIAANVSVVRVPDAEDLAGPHERLSGLALGQRGRVLALSPALRGVERRRMLDLGLLPGTEICAEIRSPAGDPTGYRVRGAVIALRREQADGIQIERLAART